MIAALLVLILYCFALWLVFAKFKWLKFSIQWGVVSGFVGVHVLVIILIGMRFFVPYTTQAFVVQHTIQIVPRLPEPTLVTAVRVEPNVLVRKGQVMFEFDRRPYENSVHQLEAQLAAAKQNVKVLAADLAAATARVAEKTSELQYSTFQMQRYQDLQGRGAGSEEDLQKWTSRQKGDAALVAQAQADEERARAAYASQINGVNTTVATVAAQLAQAQYYLDQTTIVAPEDGMITNLQVRPGMVAGIVRFGAIASFIADTDRYVLGMFQQENVKYVKDGQPVEVALDMYPGSIFHGRVASVWWASGKGQFLPSGELPTFEAQPKEVEGRFAIKIYLDATSPPIVPIGAHGAVAIYTRQGSYATLRHVVIRLYSWMNWVWPLP
jgi:multidrug resistance efflux pump